MIPSFIKKHIPLILFRLKEYHRIKPSQAPSIPNDSTPNVFIFLAADYGNLGDIAITLAQKKLLSNFFPNDHIIEVPASSNLSQIKAICCKIKNNDIITIVGGGNMGDMYLGYEITRQLIVKLFPDNKIISFPQTTDYSLTDKGQAVLKSAKHVYNNNKKLLLLAREMRSYTFMQQHFSARSIVTPDIVMTLPALQNTDNKREHIYFCLRNDKEKCISDINIKEMILLCKNYDETETIDTHIGDKQCNFAIALHDFLLKISSAKLLITDRLHGMIFSYITGTPCIAFDNSNGKVGLCYEWIKDCNYICYLGSYDKLKFKNILKKIINIKVDNVAIIKQQKKFTSIFQEILENEIQN